MKQISPDPPQEQIFALQLAERGAEIWKRGDIEKSEVMLASAQQIARSPGDKFALATALYHLGELAYVKAFFMRAGDLMQAMDYHQQSLTLRQEICDQPGTVLSIARVGVLHKREQENIVFGLCNLGWFAYRQDGDREKALACFNRALVTAELLDFKFAIGRVYHVLVELYWDEGDLDEALFISRD